MWGSPEQLSLVDPARVKTALQVMKAELSSLGLGIEITMEATHHGLTSFEIPVDFVEVGSGLEQWTDPTLAAVAAKAIFGSAQTIGSKSQGGRVRQVALPLQGYENAWRKTSQ